jgi:hypothetical protein
MMKASCFVFSRELSRYMENDSRQHMASGYQRGQLNNHRIRGSKIKDTIQPRPPSRIHACTLHPMQQLAHNPHGPAFSIRRSPWQFLALQCDKSSQTSSPQQHFVQNPQEPVSPFLRQFLQAGPCTPFADCPLSDPPTLKLVLMQPGQQLSHKPQTSLSSRAHPHLRQTRTCTLHPMQQIRQSPHGPAFSFPLAVSTLAMIRICTCFTPTTLDKKSAAPQHRHFPGSFCSCTDESCVRFVGEVPAWSRIRRHNHRGRALPPFVRHCSYLEARVRIRTIRLPVDRLKMTLRVLYPQWAQAPHLRYQDFPRC